MMAEKRDCEGKTEDGENVIKRKRLETNNLAVTSTAISNDKNITVSSDIIKHQSGHTEPLLTSVLTDKQLVVLFTLSLCCGSNDFIYMDDDVSMGDIDVWKTTEELSEMGLIGKSSLNPDRRVYYIINYKRYPLLTEFYRKKCLLSDIDKDFLIDVASDYSLYCYIAETHFFKSDVSRPQDNSSIALMRLMTEGKMDAMLKIMTNGEDRLDSDYRKAGIIPIQLIKDSEEFGKFWHSHCIRRNIHPTDWSNKICDREVKRYFSAYTILSGYDEELFQLGANKQKWSILILILMSEKYSFLYEEGLLNEKIEQVQQTFSTLNGSDKDLSNNMLLIQDMIQKDLLTMVRGKRLEFKSEDIRHVVMGYFVLNCLKTDDDYKNYIRLSSFDSVFDYVRTLDYEHDKRERCLYLPKEIEETFVRETGIDILRHVTVANTRIQNYVLHILNIPYELFYWDYEARCRYVECAKKGTQKIHKARAMIVGCAGAGKTTLLKRLQKRSLDELKQVQSTIGLEVHENIFEISEEGFLKAANISVKEDADKEGKPVLSVMDFAGQCAYYACHQVYLTERAFYLLVIDMSKSFGEKVDSTLCEQEGTMFSDWTYGEYILFWLKSVHTYCESNAPVVIVGTHFEKVKDQNSDTFYNKILDYLEFNKHLKGHLDRKRCFVLGFHTDGTPFSDTFSDLEKCIIEIAREEKWKENIPTDWALCEVVFRELLKEKSKMISFKKLSKKCYGENEVKSAQMGDVLKFYHDIGVVLYFNEEALSDTVILDIQWFIDSFKNIITDPNHVRDVAENRREWLDFYTSGHILDTLLTNIWRLRNFELNFWNRYQCKEHILRYMERLGLIAVGTVAHYIPSTNKRAFGCAEENYFHSLEYKTPVLVFRFEFLPYFFYFRLIVSCLTRTNKEWRVLQDNGLCLYKNVACFAFKQHAVALAVNPSSIQLQVFQPANTPVTETVALEVRNIITHLLNDLLENYHQKIDMYTVGFQCSKQEVFHEHDDCFVEEDELLKKGTMLCPKHELNNSHMLRESNLLFYWNLDVLAESTDPDALVENGACRNRPEPEMKIYRFHCFEKLTKLGREALQRYIDKVFPPAELFMLLQKEKNNLRRQFNKDQCDLLFPVDKSIPTSSAFDVTLMYKLLRNYGPNLPTPTKGWGKTPEPGQKTPTDDVERIRIYRNEVEHKTPATGVMEKDDCRVKWRDLCQAILRLSGGSLEKEIMNLRHQD